MNCHHCNTPHTCKRCRKTVHICTSCGRMSHDCEICGDNFTSLSAVRKHQALSAFCQKALTMTPVSLHQQLEKVGMLTIDLTAFVQEKKLAKASRRTSCPQI